MSGPSDPPSLWNDGDTYLAQETIGVDMDECRIWRCILLPDESPRGLSFSSYPEIALKYCRFKPFGNLAAKMKNDIKKSNLCDHPNVLGVRKAFEVKDMGVGAAIPLTEVQSVRNLMARSWPPLFRNGFSESCCAFLVKELLQGITKIHNLGYVHRQITAANIFYHKVEQAIKVSYGVTVFDRLTEPLPPHLNQNQLTVRTIQHWGAPPEVQALLFDHSSYTQKGDIWMVGMVCVEIAYGKMYFNKKEDFEVVIEFIRKFKKLPKKGDEMNFERLRKLITENNVEYRSTFSESFGILVSDCFAENPNDRPTVSMLLQYDFFDNACDMEHFTMDVVRKTDGYSALAGAIPPSTEDRNHLVTRAMPLPIIRRREEGEASAVELPETEPRVVRRTYE